MSGVWKESEGAGHSKVSIQKRSKGARGTYLLESTAQTDKSMWKESEGASTHILESAAGRTSQNLERI